MNRFDVIVIGAGAVGCAVATKFAEQHSVLVLERREGPGLETSQFNSGVIHSGIHLTPSYLKARLARTGSKLVAAFCQEHGVPFRQVGMHIVVAATDIFGLWTELTNLHLMLQRASRQNIPVEFVSPWTMRKREPDIRCAFALFIPEVHIMDQRAYVRKLREVAEQCGVTFRFNQPVNELVDDESRWIVRTVTDEYEARLVVNAAGLNATDVALLAGYHYGQSYCRGEYFEVIRPDLRVRSLIYPVFRPGDPGLGIHLTPTTDDRLLVGPNARSVAKNTDYTVDPTPAQAFHAAVQRFFPELRVEDLAPAHAGIRPKLTRERSENDFQVSFDGQYTPPMVNLIGIESPGLTASLALAEYIKQEVKKQSLI